MADILLLVLLVGAFVLGFFQGIVRGLLAIAAWFVAFIVAANLADPVGSFLAGQWTHFVPAFNFMLAFGGIFLLIFGIGLVAIQVGARGSTRLSRFTLAEDIMGGIVGVALAVFVLAAIIVVLSTYYEAGGVTSFAGDTAWTADAYRLLAGSSIGQWVGGSLVPGLGAVLRFVIPSEIASVMR